ncbi:MAG: hypothetical protein Q7U02_05145 [Desulfosalsimonadaceae bacterium]|nr:hypothetical protein [Desulfosalsimonadaceae bacterium]
MRRCTIGLLAVCLVWFVLGMGTALAQDAGNLITQFLPQGVTMETASQEQLVAAVGQAGAANPDQVADIVKAAVTAAPAYAVAIVQAAVNVLPDQIDLICEAAIQAAPNQNRAILDYKAQYGPNARLKGLAPLKPAREEPSPTRPY